MRSDWLDSFLAFSDCLNFTHAAEKLHISQPALHVKIRKLAEHIGTPLYRKQGRHLVLTHEGQLIQRFARENQQRSTSFLANLREGSRLDPVKLAAGEGAYLYLLGPAIKHFRKSSDYPISLVNTNGQATIEALLSGQAHVGITALPEIPDEIIMSKLTKVEQVLVIPKTHSLANKKIIKLTDLKDEPLILPPKPRPHRETIEHAFASKGIALTTSVEATGWEVILHFVKLGMGISIVNSCCHIPSTLVARPLTELPSLTYHIVELRNAWYKEAMDELKMSLLKYKDHWKD